MHKIQAHAEAVCRWGKDAFVQLARCSGDKFRADGTLLRTCPTHGSPCSGARSEYRVGCWEGQMGADRTLHTYGRGKSWEEALESASKATDKAA